MKSKTLKRLKQNATVVLTALSLQKVKVVQMAFVRIHVLMLTALSASVPQVLVVTRIPPVDVMNVIARKS